MVQRTQVFLVAISFVIIGGVFAQAAQLSPVPRKSPTERTPKLSIVYPKRDLDPVGPKSKVTIDYRNIPLSQYLWLVVETPEGGSWPHGRCDPQNLSDAGPSLIERQGTTGIWDTPHLQEIHFGEREQVISAPQRYIIHLVAVDEQENERLIKLVKEKCPDFNGQATFALRSIVETKRVVSRTH